MSAPRTLLPGTTPRTRCSRTWLGQREFGRSHFDHRAGMVFRDAESLRTGLRAVVEAEEGPESHVAGKVAFAYTGQASQWPGMGEELYESEPVARAVLDRCDEVLRDQRGASLLDM